MRWWGGRRAGGWARLQRRQGPPAQSGSAPATTRRPPHSRPPLPCQVARASESQVVSEFAYLLFYVRRQRPEAGAGPAGPSRSASSAAAGGEAGA